MNMSTNTKGGGRNKERKLTRQFVWLDFVSITLALYASPNFVKLPKRHSHEKHLILAMPLLRVMWMKIMDPPVVHFQYCCKQHPRVPAIDSHSQPLQRRHDGTYQVVRQHSQSVPFHDTFPHAPRHDDSRRHRDSCDATQGDTDHSALRDKRNEGGIREVVLRDDNPHEVLHGGNQDEVLDDDSLDGWVPLSDNEDLYDRLQFAASFRVTGLVLGKSHQYQGEECMRWVHGVVRVNRNIRLLVRNTLHQHRSSEIPCWVRILLLGSNWQDLKHLRFE